VSYFFEPNENPSDKAVTAFCLFVLLCLALMWGACTSVPETYPRHPLSEQILKPRKGYRGLTNRVCLLTDEQGRCTQPEVLDYSLDDENFRLTAEKLNFVCYVAGKRYRICKDKPGLCRVSYKEKCFIGICRRGDRVEEYLPASQYQFLLDANTECANEDAYNLQGQ
jgi:hypothetical protein